jgi:putative transposase
MVSIVFYYFNCWRKSKVMEKINDILVKMVCVKAERNEEPSVVLIDSQSTKTSEQAGVRGFDAGKKVKGRKRHILTDYLGLLLGVRVHLADIQD